MGEKKYIRVERHKWADEIEAEKKASRKRFRNLLICLLCFLLGILVSTVAISTLKIGSKTTSRDKFNYIYDLMEDEWYFGKDIENLDTFLLNNAIQGLTTNEYDIHTNYMDEDRAATYLQKLEGSVVGIGISMTQIEDISIITRVYASSPAQKAGLKQGDIIKKVNGIAVEEKTIDEIASLTKGEEGTKVTYEVLRGNETLRMEMTRATVNASVYGYMKEQVAVLDIDSISENTHKEVEYYLKKFKSDNVEEIVIDLRSNTGGYVSTVIEICSMFVGKGKPVLYELDRNEKMNDYKTKDTNVYTFDDIVLLVDENTASAAEVMATCLKTHLNATLVGTKTYGKGTVQVSKLFNDGSYIKYTIAEWLTADKKKINGIGVKPDVEEDLHPVLTHVMSSSKETYKVDSVGNLVKDAQLCLDFLGYDVDRKDGYYSMQTLHALHAFQKDMGMPISDEINLSINEKLSNKVSLKWIMEQEKLDNQLHKALEIINK